MRDTLTLDIGEYEMTVDPPDGVLFALAAGESKQRTTKPISASNLNESGGVK